jgi:3-deoxy-7-phosphoheptulonate synthase
MDCSAEPIEQKLKILLQMSLVLTWGARIPTLRIARMAGQFSKPRSKDTEIIDEVEYLAFRGDNVNSFDTSNRVPDPKRLLDGYFYSAATLNYARALLSTGFADLQKASHWDLGFVQEPVHRRQYKEMVDRILSALDFMRVCGVGNEAALRTADVFMSHEGLQLCYEEALTRPVPLSRNRGSLGGSFWSKAPNSNIPDGTPVHPPAAATLHPRAARSPARHDDDEAEPQPRKRIPSAYYNLGTHFLWIGDRTRQLDHAHVEYFRGIANPVGIKVGPSCDPAELVNLIRVLWPEPAKMPGKIVLITRFGASQVKDKFPRIVQAVLEAKFESPVVWTCDPMHGNTRVTSTGIKTRDFDDILAELRYTFEVHRSLGTHLGGCHFELTGENVTECTGGPERLLEADLPLRYTTYCDPRLNYAQGMELAFLIAQYLADEREEELEAETGVRIEAFIEGESDVLRGESEVPPLHPHALFKPVKDASSTSLASLVDPPKLSASPPVDRSDVGSVGSVGNSNSSSSLLRSSAPPRLAPGRGFSPVLQATSQPPPQTLSDLAL